MARELAVSVYCQHCELEKAVVYAVEVGGGVRQNVTEPASMQGVKVCPDCQEPLQFNRVA